MKCVPDKAWDSNEFMFGSKTNLNLSSLQKEIKEFRHSLLRKGWYLLGEGRHRFVFAHKNTSVVLKVPINYSGVRASWFEIFWAAKRFYHLSLNWHYSVTEFKIPIPNVFGWTRIGNLPIMAVEKVRPLKSWDEYRSVKNNLPVWTGFIDSDGAPQAGWTQSGRFVCYDWCPF